MDIKKTVVTLANIAGTTAGNYTDSVIINERVEDFPLEGCNFAHSIFDGVGIKNKEIRSQPNEQSGVSHCDFSHCVFRRCYFRYVRFHYCRFVNCRFVDCDFPESSFVVCDLSYAQLQNTHIDLANILSNLPPYENLQVGLLRSARMNFSNRGEGDHARRCFLVEMIASAEHYWKVAFSSHSYFRTKYLGLQRAAGFFKWLFIKFEHWFWGYGESPIKLVIWAAALIALFSSAYVSQGISLLEALRISAFAFATVGYGDHLRSNTHGIDWILVESLTGVVFVGLLAASVFKWISRRQR